MIDLGERNRRRWQAIFLSRDYRELFAGATARLSRLSLWLRRPWLGRAYAHVFRTPEGKLRRSAEHVLSDLRDFTFARETSFSSDPHMMGRREGRREVWLRLRRYLELDEEQVAQLMEIDDGGL